MTGRVRIVYFVSPSAHFAGIERTVHEIATGLMEAAGDVLDVHVVFSSRYDEAVLEGTRYTKHVLGVDRLLALPPAVRRTFAAIRADVAVFPQIEAATIGWFSTRGLGIPVFLAHLHGNPIVEEQQGTRRSKVAFAVFRHLIARRIAGALAVSPSLARYAERTLMPGAAVHFVPNPVRQLEVPADAPREPGPFRFVCVGRLSRQKGQDILLRAVRVALDAGLTDATVVLVGDGSERQALEALATELGVTDVVRFAGYTTDPGALLKTADCFVLASRWEGFGNALVEALQYGLPLLAADCHFGPADIVTDDRIGRLVPEEDPAGLGRGLIEMVGAATGAGDRDHRRRVAVQYRRDVAVAEHLRVLAEFARTARSPRVAGLVDAGDRLYTSPDTV